MTRIATRNGRPAYENAPEPRRAAVPMREWLARHQFTASSQASPAHRGEDNRRAKGRGA